MNIFNFGAGLLLAMQIVIAWITKDASVLSNFTSGAIMVLFIFMGNIIENLDDDELL